MYQFDMAVYTKIFLKFPDKFWPTGNGTEFFFYAHEKRGYYTIWQVIFSVDASFIGAGSWEFVMRQVFLVYLQQLEEEYPGANFLLVTVTDDESRRIEQQPDSDTKAEIMGVLRAMFGKNISEATDILVPRWWSDKFYRGSYSNWPIGVSRLEYDRIRVILFFSPTHHQNYLINKWDSHVNFCLLQA